MVEGVLLIHLLCAFPVIINATNQFFEELLGVSPGKTVELQYVYL